MSILTGLLPPHFVTTSVLRPCQNLASDLFPPAMLRPCLHLLAQVVTEVVTGGKLPFSTSCYHLYSLEREKRKIGVDSKSVGPSGWAVTAPPTPPAAARQEFKGSAVAQPLRSIIRARTVLNGAVPPQPQQPLIQAGRAA